ncbi:Translation initiation factor 4A [Monocercomonoides exilis]|uniref:Translation initiation factor 4A n=1 Tax=Monocercomonoides exilis TaxID=2049356 RepID=UPI003559FE75|nr:Translation initiation factor 4A [Monocercomonoides exilis]|eukprot:MONOS_6274.1-p1 / transcript=MONOS_6274.1 / gene=MONOS_6274 / organism=Monocercomonoides_exilis_PA203 / gene_product=Translation initiation factor 4A / transcript_product=Translation initiation factor 4A / location=Mono_scaffold00195:57046-57829(+) / protein_length=220 / sequence_SO=supercontig / SO=protein_coding / is_pseudo=false
MFPHLFSRKQSFQLFKGEIFLLKQIGKQEKQLLSQLLACMQKVDPSCHFTQALILTPSSELTIQTHNQQKKVTETPQHIVVGTPQRLAHMIRSEIIDVSHLRIFVLDDVDEMLSQGFKDKIVEIFSNLPKNAQTVMMSSPLPSEVIEIAHQIQNEPVRILVPRNESILDDMRQFYVAVENEEFKEEALLTFTILSRLRNALSSAIQSAKWIMSPRIFGA